jgi:hypothetical protein
MTLVKCVCGAKNRVPRLTATQRAKCGRCKAALIVSDNDPTWLPDPDVRLDHAPTDDALAGDLTRPVPSADDDDDDTDDDDF